MAVNAEDKKIIEINSARGIDGSSAITEIPEGYCIEAENVDLSEVGSIKKRAGYNLIGCRLPVRCFNQQAYASGLGGADVRLRTIDTDWLLDFETSVIAPYIEAYVEQYLDPYGAHVVRDLSNYYFLLVLGTAQDFDYSQIDKDCVVSVKSVSTTASVSCHPAGVYAGGRVLVMPNWLLPSLENSFNTTLGGASWLTTPISGDVVISVRKGNRFPYIDESSVTSLAYSAPYWVLTLNEVRRDICNGDKVLFNTVKLTAASDGYSTNMRGSVAGVSHTTVTTIQLTMPLTAAGSYSTNYFRMMFYAQYPYGAKLNSSSNGYDIISTTQVVSFADHLTVRLNADNSELFLYSFDQTTRANVLNNYFDGDENEDRLVVGSNGFFFIEDATSEGVATGFTPNTAIASGTYEDLSGTRVSDGVYRYTLATLNSPIDYEVDDIISIIRYEDTKSAATVYNFTVEVVGSLDLTLLAVFSIFRVYAGDVLHYTRTSYSYAYFSTLSAPRYTTVQFGNTGKDYPSYTWVGDGQLLDQGISSSYDFAYVARLFKPVLLGNNKSWTTLSKEAYTVNDIPSIAFNSTVVTACGEDGMFFVDGDIAYSMKLPHPPTPRVRSLPDSIGWLETELDSSGKLVGKEVRIIVTYSFEDKWGNRYESSATNDSECVIRPNPLDDGSRRTEMIEVSVKTLPSSLKIPIGNVKINIYRDFVDEASNTLIPFKLDKSIVNDPTLPYISVLIGDVPSSLTENSVRLYRTTQDNRGNFITGPNSKFLASVGNRVVAGNEFSPGYVTLKCKSVFDYNLPNAPFNGWLELRLSIKDFLLSGNVYKDYVFRTLPLGAVSMAPSAGSLTLPAYWEPAGSVSSVVTTISTNAYAVTGMTYSDFSNTFEIEGLDGSTSLKAGSTSFKLRTYVNNFPTALDFDFFGTIFERNTISTANAWQIYVDAPTRWNDPSLATVDGNTNVPSILGSHYNKVVTFPYLEGNVVNGNDVTPYRYFKIMGDEVRMYFLNGTATAYTSYVVVFHGLGNLGIPTDADGRLLSWDSDLVFLVDAIVSTGDGIDSDGTNTWYYSKLLPQKLTYDGTNVGITPWSGISWKEIVTRAGTNVSFKIFGVVTSGTLTARRAKMFNFNSQGDTLTVTSNTTNTAITAMTRTAFNMSSADIAKLSDEIPSLDGSFRVVSVTGTSGAYTVTLQTGRNKKKLLTGTHTLTLSSLTGSFFTEFAGTIGSGTITLTLGTARSWTAGDIFFLLVRSSQFNTVDLELSGWYKATANGTTSTSITLKHIYTGTTQKSKVYYTGGQWACLLSAGGGNNIPVPVPIYFGSPETLYDLALPYFTQNKEAASIPLNVVCSRLAVAINTVIGDYFTAYYNNADDNVLPAPIPDNGLVIMCNRALTDGKAGYKFTEDGEVDQTDAYKGSSTANAQLDKSFAVVKKFTNDSNWELVAGDTGTADDAVNYPGRMRYAFRQDLYPNRVRWTKQINKVSVGIKEGLQFKSLFYRDIESGDGDTITGIVPFKNDALIFKNNSIWRMTFNDDNDDVTVQRIQSTVGAASDKNVAANDEFAFFVHSTGVYATNGNQVQPMLRMGRPFKNRVLPSESLLSQGASYHNSIDKFIYLGVPYSDTDGESTTDVEGQFVYCYNDNVQGWSVNTNLPAVWWTRVNNLDYFSGQDGGIYRIRYEKYLTKFNDYLEGIPFKLRTRYLSTSEVMNFKFYRNALFKFGANSTFDMVVKYRLNYYTTDETLETLSMTGAATSDGIATYGTTRFVAPRRQTFGKRLAEVSFLLENSETNTDSPVYFVGVEGLILGSRLNPMKGMRPGTDQR